LDNLTHTLFAATLSRTPLARAGRGATAALVLGSNAPDIDVVSAAGGALTYLDWHRDVTHGLVGIAGLGLLTAGVVWLALHRPSRATSPRPPPASLPRLLGLACLGVALHIVMDLPTPYGTRVLSPFDGRWFTTDWIPIVDIYLLAVLAAGLLVGRKTRRGIVGAIVLLLMACNYGVRALSHRQALNLASTAFSPALPPPCSGESIENRVLITWESRPRIPGPPARDCLTELAALPSFTSPFRWHVIAQTSDGYEIEDVDIFRRGGGSQRPRPSPARRYPNHWTPAVLRASESDLAQRFLSFARYPAARAVLEPDGSTLVQWTDVRFIASPLASEWSALDRRRFFGVEVRIELGSQGSRGARGF
jgi:membrane-bound metal-dependent hydrolase YbcI (DUF457 family)